MSPTGVAVFNDLRFPASSRGQLVQLRFKVSVQWSGPHGGKGVCNLISNFARPIVVTSGENMYGPALCKIIEAEAFDGGAPVAWPLFVNQLQWHYLETTRQDKAAPPRPLSLHDISYIHQSKVMGYLCNIVTLLVLLLLTFMTTCCVSCSSQTNPVFQWMPFAPFGTTGSVSPSPEFATRD